MLEQIHFLARKTDKLLAEKGEDFGLSPFLMRVLIIILNNPRITGDSITKRMVVDKALVTRSVQQLEKKGYVKREANPLDKRSSCLIPGDLILERQEEIFAAEQECESMIKRIAAIENLKFF
ncbi:MAG: MarR family transcriptional regulator [Selenomonadaceae bacterium]|nr:MarR family transcriptional regulator [Selenomonadaceae bacterium]